LCCSPIFGVTHRHGPSPSCLRHALQHIHHMCGTMQAWLACGRQIGHQHGQKIQPRRTSCAAAFESVAALQSLHVVSSASKSSTGLQVTHRVQVPNGFPVLGFLWKLVRSRVTRHTPHRCVSSGSTCTHDAVMRMHAYKGVHTSQA
jgi:hypothetical protein